MSVVVFRWSSQGEGKTSLIFSLHSLGFMNMLAVDVNSSRHHAHRPFLEYIRFRERGQGTGDRGVLSSLLLFFCRFF